MILQETVFRTKLLTTSSALSTKAMSNLWTPMTLTTTFWVSKQDKTWIQQTKVWKLGVTSRARRIGRRTRWSIRVLNKCPPTSTLLLNMSYIRWPPRGRRNRDLLVQWQQMQGWIFISRTLLGKRLLLRNLISLLKHRLAIRGLIWNKRFRKCGKFKATLKLFTSKTNPSISINSLIFQAKKMANRRSKSMHYELDNLWALRRVVQRFVLTRSRV